MIKHEALKMFVAVAEAGNILHAAERRGRSPAAVSMSLKQLEENIGGTLFDGDRKAKLSNLGEHVYAIARAEIDSFERATESIRAFARNELGRVNLATVPSIGYRIMPLAISSFLETRPEVELDLMDADTKSIVSLVETGAIDFGVGGQPRQGAQVEFERLVSDRFVVLCGEGHRLAELDKPITVADLKPETVIANGSTAVIPGSDLLAARTGPRLMVRNMTSLIALVRQGIGVTILPELAVPLETGLTSLPFHGAEGAIWRDIGLLQKRGAYLAPAAVAFRDHLKEIVLSDAVAYDMGKVAQ